MKWNVCALALVLVVSALVAWTPAVGQENDLLFEGNPNNQAVAVVDSTADTQVQPKVTDDGPVDAASGGHHHDEWDAFEIVVVVIVGVIVLIAVILIIYLIYEDRKEKKRSKRNASKV